MGKYPRSILEVTALEIVDAGLQEFYSPYQEDFEGITIKKGSSVSQPTFGQKYREKKQGHGFMVVVEVGTKREVSY